MSRWDDIDRFKERRAFRLMLLRMDADEDEESSGNKGGGHGNTRIPYGLCQREGITIEEGWSPSDAWAALEGKGYSAKSAYKELRETGHVTEKSKTPKETPKPKMSKKDAKKFIKEYDEKSDELKRKSKEAMSAMNHARLQMGSAEGDVEFLEFKASGGGRVNEEELAEARRDLEEKRKAYAEAQKAYHDADDEYNEYRMAHEQERKDAVLYAYPTWEDCKNAHELIERANSDPSMDGADVTKRVLERAGGKHITVKQPVKLDSIPDEDTVINTVGGGDMTPGSCASVGLAYVANKFGLGAMDFRGGSSRKLFAEEIVDMAHDLGGKRYEGSMDITASHKAFEEMQDGKEYYFATGRHAAIIRKNGDGFEYLELQSHTKNGWKELNDSTLRARFKASVGLFGGGHAILIETEAMSKSPSFGAVIGLINTEDEKQKKGRSGYER